MLFGPPGGDAGRAPLHDPGLARSRLAAVGQLLVLGPLRAGQLQPALLPAGGAGPPHDGGRARRAPGPPRRSPPSCAGAGRPSPPAPRSRSPLLVPLAVVAGTYPFLLGLAIALATILALQARAPLPRPRRRGLRPALAHPLALAFLLVVLLAVAVTTSGWWRSALQPGAGRRRARAVAGAQALLLRGFSTGGARYPFDPKDALAIAGFCVVGLLLTRGPAGPAPRCAPSSSATRCSGRWRSPSRRPLGGNAVRLMLLMGVPLLMLPLAARGFRPRGIAVACVAVALPVAGPAGGGRLAHRHRVARAGRELLVPGRSPGWPSTPSPTSACRWWRPPTTGRPTTSPAAACRWRAAGSARTTSPPTRCSTATSRARTLRELAAAHRRALRVPARRPARLQRPQRGRAAALGRRRDCDEVAQIGGWTVFELPRPDARSRRRPTASRSSRSPRTP